MLRTYVDAVRRRLWLLPIGVVVAVATAAAVSASSPPRYESTVRLIAGRTAQTGGQDYWGLLADQELAKTYAELVATRPVLGPVIARLGLPTDAAALARRITVTLIPETRLIDVTVESQNPEEAATIANAIGEQLATQGPAGASPGLAVRQNVQRDIDRLLEQSRQGEAELDQLNQQIQAAEAVGADASELRRRRETLQQALADWQATRASLYETLLKTTGSGVSVVAPAAPAAVPSSFGTAQALALALPLGLALAIGAALLLEALDTTLRDPARLPTDERMPYLGSIPRFAVARHPTAGLVARFQPRSPAAEGYRAIRTALRGVASPGASQVLLVTSSETGEGKTTTAANLAVLLAQLGKRVVLVDADLRKPALHRLFELDNRNGLADALQGAVPPLMQTGIERLRLLSSGPPVPNPAELLATGRMERLLQTLRESADVIVMDSPPVLAVTDAAVIAPWADQVLLVAGAGLVTTEHLLRARDVLLAAGARLAGVVLTRAEHRSARVYGSYLSEPAQAPAERERGEREAAGHAAAIAE